MSARKFVRAGRFRKTGPAHPNYQDEINDDQIQTIRRLADPDGKRAAKRVALYPSICD
ncbi:hypothetical protein AAG594_14465 [Citromicrobium bathyomarinum]